MVSEVGVEAWRFWKAVDDWFLERWACDPISVVRLREIRDELFGGYKWGYFSRR